MTIFPQLDSGAFAQFPTVKRRNSRTVLNQAADGSSVRVADPAGGGIEWQLRYLGLTDAELGKLEQFYTEMEGALHSFTFLDPIGNLLARTDELSDAAWDRGPLLNLTGDVADPMGGNNGWNAVNTAAGPQTLVQTLNAPGGYLYCFSVYGRAASTATITLLGGPQRVERALTADWTRMALTVMGDAAADSIAFGIEIPGNGGVDLFGPQVEPQPGASGYKSSVAGGVYVGARFRDNTFTYTTTDVNRHSATVNIHYADHL